MLTLPAPETVPAPAATYACRGYDAGQVIACSQKARRIVARLYGPADATPHGYDGPLSFVEACRRDHARKKISRLLLSRLIERRIARGQLVLYAGGVVGTPGAVHL